MLVKSLPAGNRGHHPTSGHVRAARRLVLESLEDRTLLSIAAGMMDQPVPLQAAQENQPPVLLNVPTEATIPDLALYTFNADATDPDLPAQWLTFSLVGQPAGAVIGPASGIFTWTPDESQGPGDYTFTVRVNDGVVATDQLITLHVIEGNRPPVLLNVPVAATTEEMALYSFDAGVTDSDVPVQTLTFSLLGQPAGATIDPATGVFTWTPDESRGPGSYRFTVRVSDGVANTDQTMTLYVTEANQAPVLLNVPLEATTQEMALYSFDASATDPDLPAQTLTFSLLGQPAGATINSTTGVFSWTPDESRGPGDYTFTVRVSDGVVNTDQTVTLHVTEVNRAPVLLTVPLEATTQEMVLYSFDASATDPDLPAQTLTFSLLGQPAGAAIDPTTGLFTWMPDESRGPGDYTFTVRVSDGVVNTDQTVTLHVTEVNRAPALLDVPLEATTQEMVLYSFDASATDPDLPTQTLTFFLLGQPAGAAIDPTTGLFTWTPDESRGPGDYTFTVRVSDGVVNTDQEVVLHVTEVNRAPVLLNVPLEATTQEMVLYSFDASATDPDLPAQTLTFSLLGQPAGAAIDPTTGLFTWTPDEPRGPGDYTFSVRVSDGVVNTDQEVVLHVTEVNRAPVLAPIGNRALNELETLTFTTTASDPDEPPQGLSYSLDAASLELGMTIDALTGEFRWAPTEDQGGASYPVTITVTDSGTPNLSDSETIQITVGEVNRPPVLAPIGNRAVNELETLTFTATASDPDEPPQGLSYSLDAASLELGMTINALTGEFHWAPTEDQGGATYPVTITVTDSGTPNLSDSEAIQITVGEVNRPPILAPVGNKSIGEGYTLTFTVSSTDPDEPPQGLTYSLDTGSLALGMTIDPGSGVFRWTPSEEQGGMSHPVTITVTDNGVNPNHLTDSETIQIAVAEVNQPPALVPVGDRTVNELETLTFTVTATDPDVPLQALSYSLDGASLALGMTIDPGSGIFRWTPGEAQGGQSYPVTIAVTDNGANPNNLLDSETIQITVAEVNRPPVLAPVGNKSTGEGYTLTFTASATDPDEPPQGLTYSLDTASLALGMTMDPGSGVFSWTPSEIQGGQVYTVTIAVTDNGTNPNNLTDSETIQITVDEVNRPPVLATIGNKSVDEETMLTFMAMATDPDLPAQGLSYSLDGGSLALGMTIDPATGAFQWTPSEAQGGQSYPVTIAVTDNGANPNNLLDSETIQITVAEMNRPPVLAPIGDKFVGEGDTLTFTASATDPDVPAQGLSYTLDAASLALGMTIDPGSGVFRWTPSSGQSNQSYPVTITVTDNGANPNNLTDSETFQIGVAFFFDAFYDTATNQSKNWDTSVGVTIDAVGFNEPSLPYSLRLNGDDRIHSKVMDLSGYVLATLRYYYERTGGGDSPETGDDLILEYRRGSSGWIELERQLGSGPDMTDYVMSTISLPPGALGSNFQFRFRTTGSEGQGRDDWFVDDVAITVSGIRLNASTDPGDIILESLTADGALTLSVTYRIDTQTVSPFDIGFYRSANTTYEANDALLSSARVDTPDDLAVGVHTKTLTIGGGIGQVPLPGAGSADSDTEYYLLAVADPANTITETDDNVWQEDNTAIFQGVYHPTGGNVYAHGTPADDTVSIGPGGVIVDLNGSSCGYAATDVSRIRIWTYAGSDTVNASTSAKALWAMTGEGNDTVFAGSGRDILIGGAGNDVLVGGLGNDALTGNAGDDTLTGGAGNDTYVFDADTALGSDTLDESGGGIDTLSFATTSAQSINVNLALATPQVVNTNLTLTLSSASAFENVIGGWLQDRITGNALANTLTGGRGNDTLAGGAGNDTYLFDADAALGNDILDESGGGIDTLDFSATAGQTINVNLGLATAQVVNRNLTLTLSSASTLEKVIGGSLGDTITGNALANALTGGRGNDTLRGGAGNDTYLFDADIALGTDTLDDSGGIDTLDFSATTGQVIRLDLGLAAAQTINTNLTLILSSVVAFENAIGGSLGDTITGNALDNLLLGTLGNDTLRGGDGRDVLIGGTGADSLWGGNGDDILIGGKTLYYNENTRTISAAALNAIISEWSRADADYGIRRDHLLAGGGLNGKRVLNATTLLSDSAAVDSLYGESDRDWFLASVEDLTPDWVSQTETKSVI